MLMLMKNEQTPERKALIPQERGIVNRLEIEVADKIVLIHDMEVIADADVAALYEVATQRVNEAVKNNPEKFPKDYLFALNNNELLYLQSKISTTNVSRKSRNPTMVFTEKGLYMLATILKGERARNVTFAIIETFAKVRSLKKELVELHQEADGKKQAVKMKHFGDVLSDIVMPDLQTSETESSLEINFIVGKLKHTVKRRR